MYGTFSHAFSLIAHARMHAPYRLLLHWSDLYAVPRPRRV